jgi:GNAT superfamily N-acetyltransferase
MDMAGQAGQGSVTLRTELRPGDIGWVIERHGTLYAEEYGWGIEFESLAAEILAKIVQDFDPRWDRCWLAELDGERVGSVFVVRQSETVAKLRLLLVEPKARGHGIGRRLVEECLRFAREAGYQEMTLWTQSILLAARHIYGQAGFRLVRSEPYNGIKRDLISETWQRPL